MIRKEISLVGTIRYYNEQDLLHREDGPALEYTNGDKAWYFNGLKHRLDGPAKECSNGNNYYHIMGKIYSYKYWLGIKDFPLLW